MELPQLFAILLLLLLLFPSAVVFISPICRDSIISDDVLDLFFLNDGCVTDRSDVGDRFGDPGINPNSLSYPLPPQAYS